MAQDPLYDAWRDGKTRLEFRFEDGAVVIGYLMAYDTYALQVMSADDQRPYLIFKQSLSWIRPLEDGSHDRPVPSGAD